VVPVTPRLPRELPPSLAPLVELALDLRWTWSHGGDALWRSIDNEVWELTQNPWFILQEARREKLDELANDAAFKSNLLRLCNERQEQLRAQPWCVESVPALAGHTVAYFSMEFGLGAAVPLYAGGLGILAGDYLKAASDLGVPVVGVGILFQEGYFRQSIDADGRQHERYPYNDPSVLPIQPVHGADGAPLRIQLDVTGRKLWIKVWLAQVGRVSLYLLDTNDLLNNPSDRGITAQLYGGGPETRLLQELVLGVGGFRLLEALGLPVSIVHMNEGHAAFAALERARSFMSRERVIFREALWATRAGNVFTTHTSVAAGFDRFDPELVSRLLLSPSSSFSDPGIAPSDFLALGRSSDSNGEAFNMAYLAVRGAGFVNGVSRLHGEVSRRVFADLFPLWPEREVPIDHVTNGVHVPSWDSAAADTLWTNACGKERWRGSVEGHEPIVSELGDDLLWSMRSEQRRELVADARRRLALQLTRRGMADADVVAPRALDPDVLTLGFARRFAEYKRPDLLLRDPERLLRLLNDGARPVQMVVAGKAHPADEKGKEMIAAWIRFARLPEARGRVVFIEDYDIALAERLTQGVDVWINTPRRLWEACGTSGMKVLVNGGLNLSERDGWWAEAYAPDVGWGLGDGDGPASDADDADALYTTLEREVVPEFYERDAENLPRRWLARIRASTSRLTPRFSANRMLREYLERMYVPAVSAYTRRTQDGARIAKDLSRWQAGLEAAWKGIRFGALEARATTGRWTFRIPVSLGGIDADAVRVELYADPAGESLGVREPMKECAGGAAAGTRVFECTIATSRPVSNFTPRVVPFHPEARLPLELPLLTWQR
jgi:starch phosphorylase